jgi:photosystem II stability/assembly factor-like uncharacterized protein
MRLARSFESFPGGLMRKWVAILLLLLTACLPEQNFVQPQLNSVFITAAPSKDLEQPRILLTTDPAKPATTPTLRPLTPTNTEIFPTKVSFPTVTPLAKLQPGSHIQFSSIKMVNEASGWGVEKEGHILHTQDGGSTWKDITPPQGSYSKGGFFALDERHAWAIPEIPSCYQEGCSPPPDFVTIWRTNDAGMSWAPSFPVCMVGDCGYDYDAVPEFYHPVALQILNQSTGWILLTVQHVMNQDRWRIYRTLDGGKTWMFQSDNLTGPMISSATGMAFLDSQTGWLATSNVGGATDPIADWSIYKTQGAGKTWENIALPKPNDLPINFVNNPVWCGVADISTIPADIVDLTISCVVYKPDSRPNYLFQYHSIDRGHNWQITQASGSVYFLDGQTGWRLETLGTGNPNQLQHTHDASVTWSTLKIVAWDKAQFSFVNDQMGWAVVWIKDISTLVTSNTGGRTWVEIKPKTVH